MFLHYLLREKADWTFFTIPFKSKTVLRIFLRNPFFTSHIARYCLFHVKEASQDVFTLDLSLGHQLS